jgi:ureidoglycolate hydrolase
MDEHLLEIFEFNGIGYRPLIDFGTWRVAMLRYIDELIPDRIERVERHKETDEVFVLLAGQAILFIGQESDTPETLHSLVMQPLKQYNVKRDAWHVAVLSHDASILLIENRDTGITNTDYAFLNQQLRRQIIETAARDLPLDWPI